jgi:hypothetical protein
MVSAFENRHLGQVMTDFRTGFTWLFWQRA